MHPMGRVGPPATCSFEHCKQEAVGHDLAEESKRHRQFADLRIKGEWFRYEEPLVSHIAGLA